MFPSLFPVQNGFPPPLDAPAPISSDLMNTGISSVGRPADLSSFTSADPSNGGIAAAGRDRALAKLQRQSKGDALMALGAELLGSRTFGEGLSRGIMAYQQTLRANRPTSKPIGDGEYEEVTDPRTGETTYRATPIHADKVADRAKPTVAGNNVYQYGLDASGHYDGSVKDLTPKHLVPTKIRQTDGSDVIVFQDADTGEVFDAKGAKLSGPATAPASTAPAAPAVSSPPGDVGAITASSESNSHDFNPDGSPVTSPVGAKYAMQVMPSTAANPGYGIAPAASDTPAEYDRVGNSLLGKLQAKYGGDMMKAWGGYNWGPAKVDRAAATYGDNWLAHAPKSVQNYVAKNMAALGNSPPQSGGVQVADNSPNAPYYTSPDQAAPAADTQAPTNQWGLQPHNFAPGAPAVRYLNADEKKAAGYPADAVVQRNAKGADTVLDKGTAAGEGPLGPAEEEFYAQAVMAGTPVNQLVPGMGKTAAAQRHQVMSRVAKDSGADGLSGGDFAIQLAHYKGSVANVTNLEKQLGTIKGNEETARLNGDQFLKTSAMLPAQTASKLLNMPIQTYLRSTGDPNVAKMDVAARTFAIEYAKVVQGTPNGGGTITDSAANEAVKIMAGDYSLKQKMAAVSQAKIDMENRLQALTGNLQSSYAHMKDRAPEITGNVRHVSTPAEAKGLKPGTHFIGPDGVERVRH